MKIKKGDKLESIILPTIEGKQFNTENLINKRILITFYRFASCPLCNLRINEFVRRYDEFGKNFTMVAIFHSTVDNLNHFTSKHNAPFPILADKNYHYYDKYEVKRSLLAFLLSQITRGLNIFLAMTKGYIPYRIKGALDILPVDVLINEDGIVEKVKYGKDIGDHMSFDEVKSFANAI